VKLNIQILLRPLSLLKLLRNLLMKNVVPTGVKRMIRQQQVMPVEGQLSPQMQELPTLGQGDPVGVLNHHQMDREL
jgi:hypothetical protein